MKRRAFVGKAFMGLPMLMTRPNLLWRSSPSNSAPLLTPKSVIVIGAGISGLAAAKKLKDNGFSVTVLEAQNKVGGRLRTDRSLGVAFDEGASWIHGITNNPITTLAQQAGMTTTPTSNNSLISYDIGRVLRSDADFTQKETEWKTIEATMMNSGSATQSFQTVFNALHPTKANDRLWKFFLSTYMTFDRGDLDKTSSLLYNEGLKYGGGEVISTNGYDTIPNHLATGLTVLLNQRVSSINYTSTNVVVTHNGTTSQADYVLVTVPLGVLKNNAIAFTPRYRRRNKTRFRKSV